MKRKVVRHGSSSLTISLPFQWAKNHGIRKGKELDVREVGRNLIISTDTATSEKICTLKIKDSSLFLRRYLITLYKQGYNQIRLEFEDKLPMSLILDKMDEMLGFEIVEHGNKFCVIRNVANVLDSEFDVMLRRLFFVTLSLADETKDALKAGDINQGSAFCKAEKENDKLVNFCQRIVNLNGAENLNTPSNIFALLEHMEIIGDAYCDMYTAYTRLENKPSDAFIRFHTSVNTYLREAYECYYAFDTKKLADLKNDRKRLNETRDSLFLALEKKELLLLSYLQQILESTHHIVYSIIKI